MKISSRLGVRASLILAFVGISGFAVLATVAAMYSFQGCKRLFDKITEQRVPTALAAQELSSRVGRILAETPDPARGRHPARAFADLEQDRCRDRGNRQPATFAPKPRFSGRHPGVVERCSGFVAFQLVLPLHALVGERIVLAKSKAILLDEILKEHEETMTVLGPWIINVNTDVQRLRTAVDDSRLSAADRSTSETELIASLTLLASLQQILQSVTEIHASLLGAASAEKHERLDLLKLRTQWSMEALGTLATVVGASAKATHSCGARVFPAIRRR